MICKLYYNAMYWSEQWLQNSKEQLLPPQCCVSVSSLACCRTNYWVHNHYSLPNHVTNNQYPVTLCTNWEQYQFVLSQIDLNNKCSIKLYTQAMCVVIQTSNATCATCSVDKRVFRKPMGPGIKLTIKAVIGVIISLLHISIIHYISLYTSVFSF